MLQAADPAYSGEYSPLPEAGEDVGPLGMEKSTRRSAVTLILLSIWISAGAAVLEKVMK